MKKKMIILVGCPGSGKSTWTKKYKEENLNYNIEICSADHFFMNEYGDYKFDPSKLAKAHNQCRSRARDACGDKYTDIIIIDNCNILREHRKQYEDIAHQYGIQSEVVVMESFIKALESTEGDLSKMVSKFEKRNVHNVPAKCISKMINNYEE